MKIFIDGKPYTPASPESAESKKNLLEEIEAALNSEGRVYTSISVDGNELEPEAFLRVKGGMEARFTTSSVQQLVAESLHEGVSYVQRLSGAIQGLAGDFERRDTQKAQANLAHFAEGMSWLVNVMDKSQKLLGITDPELGDKARVIDGLKETLSEISACVAEGRDVEIAFHLRGKITEGIAKFALYFEKLLAHATQK